MTARNEIKLIKQEALLSEIEIQERIIQSYEKAVYENIGQVLSLVKMQVSSIDLEKAIESKAKLKNSGKLIGHAIQDLRYMTTQPGVNEIMEKGFASAIEHELDRVNRLKICNTNFKSTGHFLKLNKEKELLVFSILQELILDILAPSVRKLALKLQSSKHAINVRLFHYNKAGNFLVKDLLLKHVKLNERLKSIKAELTTESYPGKGIIFIAIKI
ncbi:MAG: hypothetical protein ABIQ31_24935 [Ferruginibacter sp.]